MTTQKVKGSRRERAAKATQPYNHAQTRWVNVDIRNHQDADAIKQYSGDTDAVLDALVSVVDAGIDVVFKRERDSSRVIAYAFARDDRPNGGVRAVSANASDAWVACTCLMYKVAIKGAFTHQAEEVVDEFDFR